MPSEEEFRWFAQGLASGEVTDAQAGAFAMGVCLQGLGEQGRVALTLGMRDSGRVLEWRLDKPVLDKHSTGGVGDAVSLILAPALAACGVAVPMISGRGLGHTGGTLDKMGAIPGVEPKVSEDLLRRVVAEVGCAIAGATASASVFMNAPDPHFTSSTSPSSPAASFFDRIDAVMRSMLSTVPDTSRIA